eukprot:scaffold3031_cov393-Prasinococcus_capsulatus_cf.AAC.1
MQWTSYKVRVMGSPLGAIRRDPLDDFARGRPLVGIFNSVEVRLHGLVSDDNVVVSNGETYEVQHTRCNIRGAGKCLCCGFARKCLAGVSCEECANTVDVEASDKRGIGVIDNDASFGVDKRGDEF